jgi:hypothetical protein
MPHKAIRLSISGLPENWRLVLSRVSARVLMARRVRRVQTPRA